MFNISLPELIVIIIVLLTINVKDYNIIFKRLHGAFLHINNLKNKIFKNIYIDYNDNIYYNQIEKFDKYKNDEKNDDDI